MRTGVYMFKNLVNSKMYIGSTSLYLRSRHADHIYRLRHGIHANDHLQKAWNKYGEDSFVFGVIEYCAPEECVVREQYWLDYYQSYDPDKGYNILKLAFSNLGRKYPPEFGEAIRQRMIGKPKKPETIEKHRQAITGKRASAETRRKMSESHKLRHALRKANTTWI